LQLQGCGLEQLLCQVIGVLRAVEERVFSHGDYLNLSDGDNYLTKIIACKQLWLVWLVWLVFYAQRNASALF
jgi:hypothetical protein